MRGGSSEVARDAYGHRREGRTVVGRAWRRRAD